MNKQTGLTLVKGLLIALLIAIVGIGGYTVWNNSQDDDAEQTETVLKTEQQNSDSTEKADSTSTVPEGWASLTDEVAGISFIYPVGWDNWGEEYPKWTNVEGNNGFIITKTTLSDSFLAPLGGGGGGLKHIYDATNDRWLNLDTFESTVEEGGLSENLSQSKYNNLQYSVAQGPISEGDTDTYYVLVTDGDFAYQIEFPRIREEFDKNSEQKIQEHKDSATKIVESINFL